MMIVRIMMMMVVIMMMLLLVLLLLLMMAMCVALAISYMLLCFWCFVYNDDDKQVQFHASCSTQCLHTIHLLQSLDQLLVRAIQQAKYISLGCKPNFRVNS
jgi:hypothetical protein